MFNKTTSPQFSRYGSIIKNIEMIDRDALNVSRSVAFKRELTTLYYSDTEIIVYCSDGVGTLCVTKDLLDDIEQFDIHRICVIKPGIFFNVIPMTQNCTIEYYYGNDTRINSIDLPSPFVSDHITRTFHIDEIYSYYYNVKGNGYHFEGEKHDFFELIYVDNGTLVNEVEGQEIIVDEYEVIIFGPNQFHKQVVNNGKPCSYLSIMFHMDIFDYSDLINRKFKVTREMLDVINHIVAISESKLYLNGDLMIAYLKILIIEIFQIDYQKEITRPTSPINQKFESEMLNEIVNYIQANIFEPLHLEDICDHFSISRSSLQNLFKDNINIAPKQYINRIKLQKSKLLIQESKYTISTIASMLGFNSIHYFSRKFTQTFDVTPTDYAKSIYKKAKEN